MRSCGALWLRTFHGPCLGTRPMPVRLWPFAKCSVVAASHIFYYMPRKRTPRPEKKRGSNREERGCKNPILLPSSSPPSSTFPPFPSTPFSLIKIEVTVFPLPNRRLLHGPKGVYCKGHYIRREYYCGKSRLVAGRERSQEQASATSVCRRT